MQKKVGSDQASDIVIIDNCYIMVETLLVNPFESSGVTNISNMCFSNRNTDN